MNTIKLILKMVMGVTMAVVFLAGFTVLVAPNAKKEDSIVKVLNQPRTGGGTGWSTNSVFHGPVIITNHHVCEVQSDNNVTIETETGNVFIRPILKRSFEHDLCMISGVGLPPMQLAKNPAIKFDRLSVVGHPLLAPSTLTEGTYVGDVIEQIGYNAKDEKCDPPSRFIDGGFFGSFCVLDMELSLTTVPVYPGNSGSPILNKDGDVVGVVNSADTRTRYGAFIPLPYVKEFINTP